MGFKAGLNFRDNEKGFTLVELLLVCALLGVVLAGIYQFFFFSQKSYASADTQSAVIQEVNLFFTQIEKEIRSASEPNQATKAVRIINNGQQIDLYSYRDVPTANPSVTTRQYTRTSYRLNPNNTTQLQKGWITTTTAPGADANPEYGTIPDTGTGSWRNVVTNISPGDMEIFSDTRNSTISSRRLIDINLNVSHPKLTRMISMNTSTMSRTGRSTESIESGASDNEYVPVTGIILDPASITAPKDGSSYSVKATVVPANATNKNIIWSQNFGSAIGIDFWGINYPPFVVFPDYQFTYDDGTTDLDDLDLDLNVQIDRLTTRSGKTVSIVVSKNTWSWPLPNPRVANIQVRSPDGPTATLTITQPK